MGVGSSRGFGAALSDFLSFAGYVQTTSRRSPNECIASLRSNQGTSVWFGGFQTRVILPKSGAAQNEARFEMEYYRLRRLSSRSSYVVQRLRGVLYQEGGQTHLAAKVHFTAGALLWFWLALALTLVSVGLLLYTRNVVMYALIGLTGSFALAAALVLWLDRYQLVRLVRRSMSDEHAPKPS